MPPKDLNTLKRGGTPRLRQFIEESLGKFDKRGQAARDLGISPTELSFFVAGSRTPSPQRVLNFASLALDGESPSDDFQGTLDQRLIQGGYAPVFFKHMVSTEKGVLVLRKEGASYLLEPARSKLDIPSTFSDLRFIGRHAAIQVAYLIDGDRGVFLALEPISDDTDLAEGDVTMFFDGEALHFGRFSRNETGVAVSLVDPITFNGDAGVGSTVDTQQHSFDLRARVLLHFKPLSAVPVKSQVQQSAPLIRGLDKVRVGVSPFQDALLVAVGTELGLFEEEGLLVETEPVDWYGWDGFFRPDEQDPAMIFGNIFSFVRGYRDSPTLRFLYGVNLFDRGFALLAKPEGSQELGQYGRGVEGDSNALKKILADRDEAVQIRIGTIAESDWAAQLFSLCQDKKFNLAVNYGPLEQHIYPKGQPLPNRPTIVIVDSNRQAGVVNDPAVINRTQSYYLGSMPQRIRLMNDYNWRPLDELQISKPFPVNGFVGMSEMLTRHKDILLRFLRVWFRIVNYIQPELQNLVPSGGPDAQTGSRIVQRAFENGLFASHAAKLKITKTQGAYANEIIEAWSKESFPKTPFEVDKQILGAGTECPWKDDARRAIHYLGALFSHDEPRLKKHWHSLELQLKNSDSCSEDDAFALNYVHQEYVARYGLGSTIRTNLNSEPLPDLLNALSVSRNP